MKFRDLLKNPLFCHSKTVSSVFCLYWWFDLASHLLSPCFPQWERSSFLSIVMPHRLLKTIRSSLFRPRQAWAFQSLKPNPVIGSHPLRQHCTRRGSSRWWLRHLDLIWWLWLRPCSWARWLVVEAALFLDIVVIMGMFPSPSSMADEWRKGKGKEVGWGVTKSWKIGVRKDMLHSV